MFAGEHTDALYPGTLEGALRSGQRAAAQIADLRDGKAVGPVEAVAQARPEAAAKASSKEEKKGLFSRLFN
ncbi:Flavin containing amine oxidoreductase [compost metagenome]